MPTAWINCFTAFCLFASQKLTTAPLINGPMAAIQKYEKNKLPTATNEIVGNGLRVQNRLRMRSDSRRRKLRFENVI